MGRLFSQSVRNGYAMLAERNAERTILLAEEVRQLGVKQRNNQTEQDVSEFQGHNIRLARCRRSCHPANSLEMAANQPWRP
jgi:hypothetical protein